MLLSRRLFLTSALGTAAAPSAELSAAYSRMYNFDFPSAHKHIDGFIAQRPSDPLGYVTRASAHLFSELDRLGVLEADFFMDDDRIAAKRSLKPDPAVRDAFHWALHQTRQHAGAAPATDTNALFSLALADGLLTDYVAFIEKRQIASLSHAKQSQANAVKLLTIDPNFADAYLTCGISEYLLGSLPFFVKWFVKFDNAKGSKEQAVRNLKIVADKGRYLGPFARILLAVVALREKQPAQARLWLEGLVREFPENPLLRRELQKLTPRIQ